MQKLLANYLFQNQNCPILQIGSLHIKFEPAVFVTDAQKIHAPISHILFSNDITDSKNLTEYIAINKNISFEEAAYQLTNISNEILHLKNAEQFLITGVGYFTKSVNDQLLFNEIKVGEYFSPHVIAEGVIESDDAHTILRDDEVTQNITETEFFTDTVSVKKNNWWLWAAALFVISIILIIGYVNNKNHNSFFGLSQKVEMNEASNQYHNIP